MELISSALAKQSLGSEPSRPPTPGTTSHSCVDSFETYRNARLSVNVKAKVTVKGQVEGKVKVKVKEKAKDNVKVKVKVRDKSEVKANGKVEKTKNHRDLTHLYSKFGFSILMF